MKRFYSDVLVCLAVALRSAGIDDWFALPTGQEGTVTYRFCNPARHDIRVVDP